MAISDGNGFDKESEEIENPGLRLLIINRSMNYFHECFLNGEDRDESHQGKS
jgi:hypothetical protein